MLSRRSQMHATADHSNLRWTHARPYGYTFYDGRAIPAMQGVYAMPPYAYMAPMPSMAPMPAAAAPAAPATRVRRAGGIWSRVKSGARRVLNAGLSILLRLVPESLKKAFRTFVTRVGNMFKRCITKLGLAGKLTAEMLASAVHLTLKALIDHYSGSKRTSQASRSSKGRSSKGASKGRTAGTLRRRMARASVGGGRRTGGGTMDSLMEFLKSYWKTISTALVGAIVSVVGTQILWKHGVAGVLAKAVWAQAHDPFSAFIFGPMLGASIYALLPSLAMLAINYVYEHDAHQDIPRLVQKDRPALEARFAREREARTSKP